MKKTNPAPRAQAKSTGNPAGARTGRLQHPKAGEHYRCPSCGMEVEVTKECGCETDTSHFRCCNQEMQRA
jgi:hypothetical protein